MNAEKHSLTIAPQKLLDSNSQTTWAEEFAYSAVWGGLQSPVLGAAQIVDKSFDTHLQKSLQFMPAPAESQSVGRWHAQQLGAMAGMAVPFLLLHKGVGFCGNRLLGALETTASNTLLAKRSIQESIATGVLFDGLFRPIAEGQQGSFAEARIKNALIGGTTFGALTGSSIGIRSLLQAERGLTATLLRSQIGSTMLSGIPAGAVNAELTSRLYTGKGASAKDIAKSIYSFSVLGGAMGLGKRFIASSAESNLSCKLGQQSEVDLEPGIVKVQVEGTLTGNAETASSAVKSPSPDAVRHADNASSTDRPNQVTSEVVPLLGGGNLELKSDGRVLVKVGSGGEESLYYRSMGQDRVGSEFFLLFDRKSTVAETAGTISMFSRHEKTTPVSIESALGYYAEPWLQWLPAEIAALDKAIPAGSIPIGVGVKRQAWLTPEQHIVVIGPAQKRQDCPYLRTPFKVEQLGASRQIEHFEYADSREITPADVKAFDAKMRADGWQVHDNKPMNYAKSSDGKMWRIDPDDVYRETQGR